jgi:hypothetical protein
MNFKETQRFNRPWHYAIYALICLLTIGVSIGVYIFANKSIESAIAGFVAFGIVSFFWFSMRLETQIDSEGVHYRYFPFHRKTRLLKWEDIESINVKQYSPFSDYGGWGLRFKILNFNDILLNVSGNKGIRIELKSGKKFMIGTQEDTLAIESINSLKTNYQD